MRFSLSLPIVAGVLSTTASAQYTNSPYIQAIQAREARADADAEPVIGALIKPAKKVLGGLFGRDELIAELQARDAYSDYDSELLVRDPFIGKVFKKVKNTLFGRDELIAALASRSDDFDYLQARDADAEYDSELLARDPFIGKVFKNVKNTLFGRDELLEELYARSATLDSLQARSEVDMELMARDPFIKKIFKGVKNVAGGLFGREEAQMIGQLYARGDASDMQFLRGLYARGVMADME